MTAEPIAQVATAPRLLQSSLLLQVPRIRHGLTSRVVGLGGADGNVAYSPPRDASDAWEMRRLFCEALGLDPERIVTVGQVHGATVIAAGENNCGLGARPGSGRAGLGDALITADPGPVLLTLHADCLPILLVDPYLPAVATAHAGWRGTAADVVGATVRAMSDSFGSDPSELLAFLGPSIGRCCYQVGDEVIEAWCATAGDTASEAIASIDDHPHLDLKRANQILLQRAGVRSENMEVSSICTRCNGTHWFTHRGQGPDTGRFGAIIAIDPAT